MNTQELDTIVSELTTERLIVSEEDFSKISGMVQRSFNRIIAQLRDLGRTTVTWDLSRPEVINTAQVRNVLSRTGYLDLNDFLVDTPVGFNTQYELHGYSKALVSGYHDLVNVFKFVDGKAIYHLSKYIDEPELFNEPVITEDRDGVNDIAAKLASFNELVTRYFTTNREWQYPFTEVYDSNRDCLDTMSELNALNKDRWLNLHPKHIKQRIERINKLSIQIMSSVDRNKPDRENIEFLMDLVLICANATRAYAVFSTQVIDLTTALKHTEKKLLTR